MSETGFNMGLRDSGFRGEGSRVSGKRGSRVGGGGFKVPKMMGAYFWGFSGKELRAPF